METGPGNKVDMSAAVSLGTETASHITTVRDNTNCQQTGQHNPLMDECGMFASLQAGISVVV
jgi:hypothetical protein